MKKTVTPCSHSFDLRKIYSFILQIEFYREHSEENTMHNTSKKNISVSRSKKQKVKIVFFSITLFDVPISIGRFRGAQGRAPFKPFSLYFYAVVGNIQSNIRLSSNPLSDWCPPSGKSRIHH